MLTIYELVDSACEEFKHHLQERDDITENTITDIVCDIADSHIPAYTYQLLEVAMSDLRLVHSIPDRCVSSNSTPMQMLQRNIYKYIKDDLWERYEKNKKEK